VLAARLIGIQPAIDPVPPRLPNVIGPVLVIATINLRSRSSPRRTLSFLGIGLPSTQPSSVR